ncbi:MAG: PhoH family protein [Bacteroidota bacterium]
MTEKIIFLDSLDHLEFYGSNNSRLDLIIKQFPKIKIIARGNELKAFGNEADLIDFENKISRIISYIKKYNHINKEIIKKLLQEGGDNFINNNENDSDTLLFGNNGKVIKARTVNQRKFVNASLKNDLLIAVGPAGTGKTYTAIALAVRALKNKEVKKIILSRPAVEAGEQLGYLPGDLKEKLDPYLQPLYDALWDMIPSKKLTEYFEEGIIEIAPLGFMRGRTLENAWVILDEAQNATNNQLKMFLTRMGLFSKFIVTGDITQIDLPVKSKSGLLNAITILKSINGISIIKFDNRDIIRHKLVKSIVDAYKKYEED